MHENEIARIIIDVCYHIHRRLGPGLLESVYLVIVCHELRKRGLQVEREVVIPVRWDGLYLQEGFRADLIVNDKVIVELKSVEKLAPVHAKQLLTYLPLADKKLGLLINFGAPLIKEGIERIINGTLD